MYYLAGRLRDAKCSVGDGCLAVACGRGGVEPIVLRGKPFPLVEAAVGWLPDWLLVPVGRVASRVMGVFGVTGVV